VQRDVSGENHFSHLTERNPEQVKVACTEGRSAQTVGGHGHHDLELGPIKERASGVDRERQVDSRIGHDVALRPSELFGLRWRDLIYDECLLELRETVYRGKLRNWGKTRKALRPVHIPKELADNLWLWRQECKNPSPEAFIFPNRSGGFIDPQNYRKKMRKLAEDTGLPKLTFQVIRRTHNRNAGSKERNPQRHPERVAALAPGDHH
jgi:hypothetical protein